ncbi:MAG: aminodeoxychorismate lyase [Panacagrimonas sp.]
MWFNGEPVEGTWTGTRALHYGDGVFRTALVREGLIVDLPRQLAKLLRDAAALKLECPDAGMLKAEAEAAVHATGSGVLRILLSRVDSGRGYAPQSDRCDRLMQVRALPEYPRANWAKGVKVGWSPVLLGIQPRLAGIKHLNRLEQVLASRDWPEHQNEALMCDAEGRVICGTRSNIFFVIDNILVTPDVSRSGVAGMMRDKLIELGRYCEIGTISPDEVRHAQECFLTNSLIGIWPVRRIGNLELGEPGPVTRALSDQLLHPWSGA